MAEGAVSFLLNQLATLIQEERQLLGRLDENVLDIQKQLEFMRAFLRVADAEEDGDPQLQAWVKQVREVAYDAEDVIETFMLQFANLRAEDGFCGCVQKIYLSLKNLRVRHNIASDLENIKGRVTNISKGREMFQRDSGVQLRSSSTLLFGGRVDAILVDEAKLVGIDRPKELLIKELLDDETRLKAVSVWGMGGSGKSTLVKRIYEDERVKGKFQCHAWITVSQSFDIMKLLKDLIRKLHHEIKESMPQELERSQEVELKEFVKEFLSERQYIIVFDDVWSTGSWNALKHALPDKNMSSRVVLTTRTLDVANTASQPEYPGCHGCVHEMEALSYEDSWKLLCNKTFGDEIFPPHLQDCADGILDKCKGLPLAIDAVGGLLAMKDKNSVEEWSTVSSYLNTKLHGYSDNLERTRQVLLLSYYDLPYDLKTCVLYLSIFPEDHMIDHMRLIRLWIAEGFVQGKERLTKEEVALHYLEALINRSLIQVAERYPDGRVNLCRIHDIVHEILVSKSNEQNIVNTEMGRDSELPDKVRRFAIRTSIDSGHLETNRLKYLRSLILTASVDSRFESFLSKLLSGSRKLLKVLDLRDAPLGKISNEVFKHYHLTYLSLRGTEVKDIPESIGQLQCLETLDLKDTEVISLPIEILKLKRLRHLLVYKYKPPICGVFPFDNVQSFKAPYRIGCLSSLQKLCCIEADQMGDTTIVREIGKLTQLRRLYIRKLRREDGKDFCSSLKKLTELRSLVVGSIREDEIIELQDDLYFKFLRNLYLEGRLEKVPQWIPSLHSLSKVVLRRNMLSDDPLESLQDLPRLAYLELDKTFEGEKLEFKAEKFQRLKTLGIWRFNGLRKIVLEKCTMPNLDVLFLGHCKLVELPIDFEHLNKLRYFQISYMAKNFVEALENQKRSEGSNWKLAHVRNIFVDDEQGWGNL
ncbi:disease resistance protein RPM1-like [Olea europaea var. sylvestris]|uniref:disease resistance protein RPM1-like n=1 Tax=Olea europaea var. sylvestris TaxID=158386 RepID=UPI000C1CFC6D|nr:disease resistance protein RPM1-like [Olea europaea var. sylvestris]